MDTKEQKVEQQPKEEPQPKEETADIKITSKESARHTDIFFKVKKGDIHLFDEDNFWYLN